MGRDVLQAAPRGRGVRAGRRGLLTIVAALITLPSLAAEERIIDLADIAGVRKNQLIGYGLVTGLDGSYNFV